MAIRFILAVLVVFVAWNVMDAVMHGIILHDAYARTAALWRAPQEMKLGLIRAVVLLTAIMFVAIYALLISPKSVAVSLRYGLLYGIAAGIGMGYGSYASMPISDEIAFVWFAGSVVEALVAGLLTGLIIRE